MANVVRIAAVSYLDTMPFLYGLKHEGNFCAELLLSDFTTSISDFKQGRADIALVPVHVVPQLIREYNARIVTEYCIGYPGGDEDAEYLPIVDPTSPILPLFEGKKTDVGALVGEGPLVRLLDSEESWAYAVWVAHKDVDVDVIERMQYALTFGLEHTYEALLEAGVEDVTDAYDHLLHLDFIYNEQKEQTLKRFWASGMKVPLRANPG